MEETHTVCRGVGAVRLGGPLGGQVYGRCVQSEGVEHTPVQGERRSSQRRASPQGALTNATLPLP